MTTKIKGQPMDAAIEIIRYGHGSNYEWVAVIQGVVCRGGNLCAGKADARRSATDWLRGLNERGVKATS